MKVITFGELLLRLAAPGYSKLFQKDNLESTFCGGEANVAVSLAIFGLNSSFITKLPDNDVGVAAANSLRYFGVDTSMIIYGMGHMGLYYLETGASQRPSKVIYDRSYSAFALAKKTEFRWSKIFEDAEWFHWTGINPALGDNVAEICLEACKIAKKMGLNISCDLNYRSSLWSSEKAKVVMDKLMPYVDVCIANEEDIEKVLGITSFNTDVESGRLNRKGYIDVAKEIVARYGCKHVAITLRESISASRNLWSAMLYSNGTVNFSRKYDIQIVDSVGVGDSFTAAMIYSLIMKKTEEAIEFATAASCLKYTIEGDYNRTTVVEIENLIKNGGHGRVQR